MNWQDKVHNSLAEGKGGVKSLQRRHAAQIKAGDKPGAAATRTALQYRVGTRRDARLSYIPRPSPAVTDAPDLPQKKPAFKGSKELEVPTRGKEDTSKEARRAVQRAAGGGDKLTGGEDQHHRGHHPETRHKIKQSKGEQQSAFAAEIKAKTDAQSRTDRAARKRMGNPDSRQRGSFRSFSQRQDSETQLDWQNKLYESLVEQHQFSKQKTRSGRKVKGRHDPRAQQATRAAARNWSEKDPEGVDPENPFRTGLEPTIHASGLRNRRTGARIKKRR